MANEPLGIVVQRLRRVLSVHAVSQLTDRQLLEQYAHHGDEAAFTTLVQRHGPLVFGVCRRVLQNEHDAEEAFQATFLVLARKAATLAWQESVSSWLYQVACRVSNKARCRLARQRAREERCPPPSPARPSTDVTWGELRQVLDEELSRMPERYRAPLVLCYLEGKTQDEAAAVLGWSPGSVRGRVNRGREVLRSRLARRGFTLSASLFAALLVQGTASARLPATLLTATARAGVSLGGGRTLAGLVSDQAITLMEGVLEAMYVTQLKITAVVLLSFAVVGVGVGVVTHQAWADRSQAAAADPEQPREKRAEEKRGEERRREADRDKDQERKEVRAVIKAIDAAKGTLDVTTSGDQSRDLALNLARTIKVLVDGKESKLTDLAAGMSVGLQLAAGTEDVVQIRAEGPSIRGAVKSVDAAKNTITLGGEDGDKTFPLAKEASITVDGRPGKLGDIQPRSVVFLRLTSNRQSVIDITSGRGREDRERVGRPNLYGMVAAVDAGKNTVTVTIARETGNVDQTFELLPSARILSGDRPIKLADLKAGTRIVGWLAEDRRTLVTLQIPGERGRGDETRRDFALRGTLKSVANGKLTLVIRRDAGDDEQTLELSKEVRVALPGREGAQLADLKPGMPIMLRLSEDRKQITAIVVPGERREGDRPLTARGVLKAVDAAKQTITLPADGGDRTYEIGKELRVTIDGKPAKLEDLKSGMRVTLQFSRDRKTVQGIQVGGDREREEE